MGVLVYGCMGWGLGSLVGSKLIFDLLPCRDCDYNTNTRACSSAKNRRHFGTSMFWLQPVTHLQVCVCTRALEWPPAEPMCVGLLRPTPSLTALHVCLFGSGLKNFFSV